MESVIVNKKGQITIPSKLRKKYNIMPNESVLIDEKDGKIIIIPVKSISSSEAKKYIKEYTDDEIKEFIKQEQLTKEEMDVYDSVFKNLK